MSNKQPQFKNLKFKTREVLLLWLHENAKMRINLQDKGQDLQVMWLHESGEILDTDFNQDLYVGKFVNMESIKERKCIEVWDNDDDKFIPHTALIVKSIGYNLDKNSSDDNES